MKTALVRTLLVVAPLMVCAVALNDLSDVAVDRINLAGDPARPLVSGRADVSAMRADADLMVWWHAPTVETVQQAYHRLRRTPFRRCGEPLPGINCRSPAGTN